jgi:hypothetical protein
MRKLRGINNRTVMGALAVLALSQAGNGQETVNGGMVVMGPLRSSGSQAVVDFTAAGTTSPVKSGTLAARPGACMVGQMYFATDAAVAQNLAYCTSAGTWTMLAGGGAGVNTQTGTSYTLQDGDSGKLVTLSNASAVGVTLPRAGASSWFMAGWMVDVQNRGAGNVTITPATSTIDGVASLVLAQNQGARIFSDGSNYFTQRGVGSAGSTVPSTTNLLGGDGSGGVGNTQIPTTSPYSALRAGVTESTALGLGFAIKYTSTVLTDFQAAATSQQIQLATAAAGWMMNGVRLAETVGAVSASSTITAVTACLGTLAVPCTYTPGGLALPGTAGQFTTWPGPYSAAAASTATQDIYLTLTVTNANPGNLGVSGLSVSSCTNANPTVCTVTAHGFKSGSNPTVTIAGATGAWTVLNGTYPVTYASGTTLTMTVKNGTALGALTGTVTLAGSYLQAGTVTARIWGGVAQ